ncbi:MAG: hypothetical protein KME64_39940 [Scytonematopsis contorta HA4267-MV1]|nr:hypothetical protein [Scytonematopsis contorta HA4267-MV1]
MPHPPNLSHSPLPTPHSPLPTPHSPAPHTESPAPHSPLKNNGSSKFVQAQLSGNYISVGGMAIVGYGLPSDSRNSLVW